MRRFRWGTAARQVTCGTAVRSLPDEANLSKARVSGSSGAGRSLHLPRDAASALIGRGAGPPALRPRLGRPTVPSRGEVAVHRRRGEERGDVLGLEARVAAADLRDEEALVGKLTGEA